MMKLGKEMGGKTLSSNPFTKYAPPSHHLIDSHHHLRAFYYYDDETFCRPRIHQKQSHPCLIFTRLRRPRPPHGCIVTLAGHNMHYIPTLIR